MMFDPGEFEDNDDAPAATGAPEPLVNLVQAVAQVAPAVVPAVAPAALLGDAALQVVETLHPHVEAGAVSPQAALLSLALGFTRRWIR